MSIGQSTDPTVCPECGVRKRMRNPRAKGGMQAKCRQCYDPPAVRDERDKKRRQVEALKSRGDRPICPLCTVRQCAKDKAAVGGYRPKCQRCGWSEAKRLAERVRRNAKNRADPRRKVLRHRTQLREYGITPEQYAEMVAAAGGVCTICKRPESRKRNGRVTRLCVDHDHRTGRVRGVLCSRCNFVVGLTEYEPELLAGIAAYLT